MRDQRMLLAVLVATWLSVALIAGPPAVALVPPLPSLGLPLPSLPPVPSPSLLPLATPPVVPTLFPLPTVPPLTTPPPPLATLPLLATPAPIARTTSVPGPSVTPLTAGAASPSFTPPAQLDPSSPGASGAAQPEASSTPPPIPQSGVPPSAGAFDGIVGPVVALGVSALLALAVLLAQLLGGAALVPVVRRTLGDFRLRRLGSESATPASETTSPGGDAGAS